MAFPNDTDYTYAERYGRTGYKYATPIDESVSTDVVTALTSNAAYLEALTDKMAGDDEFFPALIAALVLDPTYPAALGTAFAADSALLAAISADVGTALASDATYLAGVTDAIATNLVATYAVNVPTEATSPTVPFDSDPVATPTHTFDPVSYLGDQGISPGTVGVSFLLSDGLTTEVYTDPGLAGVLTGTEGGTGTINYDTGVMTITWGALSAQTASEATSNVTYDYLVNAFEPEVVVSPASLTSVAQAVAAELATDSTFLDAIQNRVFPIWWVDTSVAAEAANVITVTFTQTGMDALAETGRAQRFRMYFFEDLAGTRGLIGNMTASVTTGMVLETVVADQEYVVMSDSVTGTIVVEVDDSVDDSGAIQYVVLVNEVTGECHTATCDFTDDTP